MIFNKSCHWAFHNIAYRKTKTFSRLNVRLADSGNALGMDSVCLGQDTRYNELKITEKGRALVNLTREIFSAADAAIFDGFSDEELETYISCLEKLQINIKKQTTP